MDEQQLHLLTPREVADLFRVTVNTVNRWGDTGRLPVVRTPTGHRRYPRGPVLEQLKQQQGQQT